MKTAYLNLNYVGLVEASANFTPENFASLKTVLNAGLPARLAIPLIHCARQSYVSQTTGTSKEVADAAWDCLYTITEFLEKAFPEEPVTGPVQFSYWEV